MIHESEYLFSQDGLKLKYQYWLPDNSRQIICIIHGLGEHSGRYAPLAKQLNDAQIGVFALDLRGHGESEGKRGHGKSLQHFLGDIEELLKTVRSEFTDLPIVLMGHSMGGNLVANFLIKMNTNEISAAILSAPWIKLAFEPPAWKMAMGEWMARIWPSFKQPNGLNANTLSRIPEEVVKYEKDELVHDRISARLFQVLVKSGESALARMSEVDKEILIYHGSDDQLISFNATKELALQIKNKSWHELKGGYHEPHNDLVREQVYALIQKFVQKQQMDHSN